MEPRATLLKASFDIAHMVFNAVVADLDDAAATRLIGGNVPAAAPIMAHAIYGEDMIVSQARGAAPLLDSGNWNAKTGILNGSPSMTPDWLALKFSVAGLREYAGAVFARTGEYLELATAAELDKMVPTPLGQEMPVDAFLGAFGIVHVSEHCGEISALKGAQGLQGLPF
jgi:hypothetical protein